VATWSHSGTSQICHNATAAGSVNDEPPLKFARESANFSKRRLADADFAGGN